MMRKTKMWLCGQLFSFKHTTRAYVRKEEKFCIFHELGNAAGVWAYCEPLRFWGSVGAPGGKAMSAWVLIPPRKPES